MAVSPLNLGRIAIAAALVADQVVKWWIVEVVMQPVRTIEVAPVFNLVLARNRGISFGLFDSGGNGASWLLAGLALAIVVALAVWLHRAREARIAIAVGAIIGGALGNVVDRLRFGWVVDFLDLHVGSLHWPAFNVADACISIGALYLVADSIFARRGSRPKMENG